MDPYIRKKVVSFLGIEDRLRVGIRPGEFSFVFRHDMEKRLNFSKWQVRDSVLEKLWWVRTRTIRISSRKRLILNCQFHADFVRHQMFITTLPDLSGDTLWEWTEFHPTQRTMVKHGRIVL